MGNTKLSSVQEQPRNVLKRLLCNPRVWRVGISSVRWITRVAQAAEAIANAVAAIAEMFSKFGG